MVLVISSVIQSKLAVVVFTQNHFQKKLRAKKERNEKNNIKEKDFNQIELIIVLKVDNNNNGHF